MSNTESPKNLESEAKGAADAPPAAAKPAVAERDVLHTMVGCALSIVAEQLVAGDFGEAELFFGFAKGYAQLAADLPPDEPTGEADSTGETEGEYPPEVKIARYVSVTAFRMSDEGHPMAAILGQKALQILEDNWDSVPPAIGVTILNNVGYTILADNRAAEALTLFQRAATLTEKISDATLRAQCRLPSMVNTLTAATAVGDKGAAEQAQSMLHNIGLAEGGTLEDAPVRVTAARCLSNYGCFEEALPIFEKVLGIIDASGKGEDPEILRGFLLPTLDAIVRVYAQLDRKDEAAPEIKRLVHLARTRNVTASILLQLGIARVDKATRNVILPEPDEDETAALVTKTLAPADPANPTGEDAGVTLYVGPGFDLSRDFKPKGKAN